MTSKCKKNSNLHIVPRQPEWVQQSTPSIYSKMVVSISQLHNIEVVPFDKNEPFSLRNN